MSEMVERVVLRERPMVERVARLMWVKRAARIKAQDLISGYLETKSRGDWTFDELEPSMQAALREDARAAIEAMREPTEAMTIEGAKVVVLFKHAKKAYQRMIDEALK